MPNPAAPLRKSAQVPYNARLGGAGLEPRFRTNGTVTGVLVNQAPLTGLFVARRVTTSRVDGAC